MFKLLLTIQYNIHCLKQGRGSTEILHIQMGGQSWLGTCMHSGFLGWNMETLPTVPSDEEGSQTCPQPDHMIKHTNSSTWPAKRLQTTAPPGVRRVSKEN